MMHTQDTTMERRSSFLDIFGQQVWVQNPTESGASGETIAVAWPVGDWYYKEQATTDESVITTGDVGVTVKAKKALCPYYFVVQQKERGGLFNSTYGLYSNLLLIDVTLEVITRIRELGTYQAGWNRPDTVAPTSAAINDAEQFVRNNDFASIHLPSIGAADDGEVNFWWDVHGLYIDLGFFGDGVYSFYARLPNGKEMTVDRAPLYRPLHPEVLKFLKKFD